jgi:tRNA nucleotidyltransferase (CCA-adding enzyme)
MAVSERLRAPIECRDLAVMLAREHGILGQADILRPETMVKVLERCDALRRPERFLLMLDAASSDFFGRRRTDEKIRDAAPREWPPAARWRAAVGAIRAVDAGAIAGACANKAQIPAAVHGARIAAVRALARPQPVQQGDR